MFAHKGENAIRTIRVYNLENLRYIVADKLCVTCVPLHTHTPTIHNISTSYYVPPFVEARNCLKGATALSSTVFFFRSAA